jgi:hypothetical protein
MKLPCLFAFAACVGLIAAEDAGAQLGISKFSLPLTLGPKTDTKQIAAAPPTAVAARTPSATAA